MPLVDIERSIASNSSHSGHRATSQQCMLFERSIAWNIAPSIIRNIASNSERLQHLAQNQLQTRTQFLRAASFATSQTPIQAIATRIIISQIARNNAAHYIACTSRSTQHCIQHQEQHSLNTGHVCQILCGTTEYSTTNPSIEIGLELQTLFIYLFIHLHLTRERKEHEVLTFP